MKTTRDKRRGIILTIIIHIGILVILITMGFHTPLPLPGEEGILINFGNTETGSGQIEPQPVSQPDQSQVQPQPVETVTPPEVSESNDVQEEVETQDFEDAASIASKKETPKKKEKTPEELEQERLEKERIEKERLAELERKRKEEEERLEKERLAKQAAEIKNRIGNAFAKSQKGDAENQGVSGGEGNQGKETGSVNSNNYGEGHGLGNQGISYSLAGRSHVYLPEIKDDSQKEGTVVVEIRVNSKGDVVYANAGVRGSTTQDAYLVKLAKEAAMDVRFNEKPNSPDQVGTITIKFVLE